MTGLKLALVAVAMFAGDANAESFAERWPRVNTVESISTVVPPVLIVQDEDKPPASRHRRQAAESNVCSRHHMRKVYVGRWRWRCRK
jgi:hypothetical protein